MKPSFTASICLSLSRWVDACRRAISIMAGLCDSPPKMLGLEKWYNFQIDMSRYC